MTETKYLVLFDTDHIHEYLFATNKLKEIRGASVMLDRLNIRYIRWLADKCNGKEIYVGGGGGKFWFENLTNAQKFCSMSEQLYSRKTIIASLTTSIVKENTKYEFHEFLELAEKQLRRKKSMKQITTQLDTNSYFKFCELCCTYPATKEREIGTESKTLVCNACYNKFRALGLRSQIYKDFEDSLSFKIDREKNYPADLTEIGNCLNSNGYVGYIYADGNGIGKILQGILKAGDNKEEKLSKFSYQIDKATKHGIIRAVKNYIPEPVSTISESRENVKIFPVEFIMAGGDDLITAVPATKALEIAADFCNNFSKLFEENFGPVNGNTVTTSCGVVIAKSSYPINLVFKQAEQLLKSAKKLGKQALLTDQKAQIESAIDFSVIKSTATGNLEAIRKDEFELDQGERLLTERPYTIDKLNELIDFIRECKNYSLPNNKLKTMQQSLFESVNQASLDYLKIISRFHNEKLKTLFKEKLIEFDPIPWRIKTNKTTTPFLDFVEIYDFVTDKINE